MYSTYCNSPYKRPLPPSNGNSCLCPRVVVCSTLKDLVALAAKKLELCTEAKNCKLCVVVGDTEVDLTVDDDLDELTGGNKVT